MAESIDRSRRRFLGTAAMTIAAARFNASCAGAAGQGVPREWAAIANAVEWLNSPRLTASSLSGKVVLVDFWTYTCINWLRTRPYVRAWAQKYRQGLMVIGVHTPEFEVERDIDNVRRAVRQTGIEHPIAIDNDYAIWRAFNNHYWPARYLLDTRGNVRHQHFGEGEYEPSERAIQRVLAEAGVGGSADGLVSVSPTGVEVPADRSTLKSGENYIGYDRTENLASPGGRKSGRRLYELPARLSLNQWALDGEWTMGKQATVLNGPSGRIRYRFHARDLHVVMGPSRQGHSVRFRVSIDGQRPGPAHGLDVDEEGNGVVVEPRLYQLIRQPHPIVDRQFALDFIDSGVEALAFTFG